MSTSSRESPNSYRRRAQPASENGLVVWPSGGTRRSGCKRADYAVLRGLDLDAGGSGRCSKQAEGDRRSCHDSALDQAETAAEPLTADRAPATPVRAEAVGALACGSVPPEAQRGG